MLLAEFKISRLSQLLIDNLNLETKIAKIISLLIVKKISILNNGVAP